jgi:hypothetical protein
MMRRLALRAIAIAAMTSGCVTTLADLRHAAPNRIGRAPGDYQALAGCIVEGLQTTSDGGLLYQTVMRPDEKRMVVTGMLGQSGASPRPLIDLTFRQVEPAHVVIESRWGGFATARMEAERIDRLVWSLTERCARGRVELTPPIVR